ncbi:mannose-1-phosphate guanylyltransferase/mannose-6-phosphate isomerase [Cupriavidus sp. DB3]|uniref:mannose-1-phosphate guanylyltransferase/mannose-6-phosphate isomerase n=1 Tax=Cupriavidus sp. DB3 TaxID=2873259 RepID=UPI001CF4B20D|nr:mannose-1-phosphate guanylyltransferase/mannose-6-phosphate isomerase [Cupriavidus sp. DB3]
MSLIPTILCGGAGSRLWPLSRELHPKPFIRMQDGESLLQKAFLRAVNLPGVDTVLTVTNRELLFKTADEYRDVNRTNCATSFLLEPFGRNTAAAVAVAAQHVASTYGPDKMMLVLAADHLIADQSAFADAVQKAVALAGEGRIVTFGIRPERPETGYGYIEADGDRVVRYVEKPSVERAGEYVASGRFLWNSGMFCFTAASMLREMREHCPDILDATSVVLQHSRGAKGDGWTQVSLDPSCFESVREDSLDYAVMEKCTRASVVACSLGWSDIGSWKALAELSPADADGNRVDGEALLADVTNSYVMSRDRVVGAIGVENLVIVDTPDALLVAHRDRTQDVKQLYAALKDRGHEAHRVHRTVKRPWGTYTVLEEGPRFKIKRIIVSPGASLSLQLHHHRSEHWIVVSGTAKVVNGEREFFVRTDESTYIPAGHKHRLENPGLVDLVMIEVQSGDYLGEDDIVRFEDAYGRV